MARKTAAALIFISAAGIALAQPAPESKSPSATNLGKAPQRLDDYATASKSPAMTPAISSAGLTLDTSARRASRNFFNAVYLAADGVPSGWTGDVSTGVAGTTTQPFKDSVALRINAVRAFAGVPAAITFSSTWNDQAQQAALMMSANNALSHNPPSSWTYYTANGANAASHSNLALGQYGTDAITGYISDPGSNNFEVGHRRWVLYPPTQVMGTGDIPRDGSFNSANDLWVFDSAHPYPTLRDGFVSWPPKGYVPYQLIFPRWSFSLASADFSAATVTVTKNGVNVGTTITSSTDNGYGDNTLVWTLAGTPDGSAAYAAPASDVTYNVTIANAKLSGVAHTYSYTVTVFDPSQTGSDDILPAVPNINYSYTLNAGVNYGMNINPVPEASRYDAWTATLQTAAWVEGAEAGAVHVTPETTGTYSAVNSTLAATGSKSFHLCQDAFNNQDLLLNSQFVASSNSALNFSTRYGYMTPTQIAEVQVSLDDGSSWTTVFSRAGTSSDTGSFSAQSVSLSAYAHRIIRLRFLMEFTGGSAYTTTNSNNVGWSIDDITPVNLQEASAVSISSFTGITYSMTAPIAATTIPTAIRAVLFDDFPLEYGPVVNLVVSQSGTTPVITSDSTTPHSVVGVSFMGYLTTATTTNNATLTFSATNLPPGLSIASGNGYITGTPTTAGNFTSFVTATNVATSEFGSKLITFSIGKGVAPISLGNLNAIYDGTPHAVTVTTTPSGLATTVTYRGSATVPTAVGNYAVSATVNDANYIGLASGALVIANATASVSLGNLSQNYDGSSKPVTVTTTPAGLATTVTYDGKATVPSAAGSYAVVATITNPNYTASASGTLVINPGVAVVTLGALAFNYDGKTHATTATTSPAKLPVTITYNGSPTAPSSVGSYNVVATINSANYSGTANGTLVISPVLPLATTGAASLISATGATVSGTTNPKTSATTVSFQYGITTAYGSTSGSQNAGSGLATVNVSAVIPVTPSTIATVYHYRIVATNAAGTTLGADKTFTALAQPSIATSPQASLGASGSEVNLTVNPNGAATSVYFQFGTTTSYGSVTATQNLGSGKTAVNVFALFPDLQPSTTYHYRLVMTGTAGTFFGPDQTFTTLAFDTNLIAQKGDAATGTPTTFATFGNPAINLDDLVAFTATLTPVTGVTTANNAGIWTVDSSNVQQLIARTGSPAVGTAATFATIGDPLTNDSGAIAFKATLTGATTTTAIGIWSTSSGSLQLVARQGSSAPGTTGTFATFTSLGLSDTKGAVIFATLNAGTGISAANNSGVWEGNSANDLALILRLGQVIDGKTITKLSFLPVLTYVNGQTRSYNSAGNLICSATFSDKTTGLVRVINGTPHVISTSATPANGTGGNYATFGNPALNDNGRVAFAATLTANTAAGVTTANNSGIWADDGTGVWQLVARTGTAAPDTAALFATLGDPVYNINQTVAFRATLKAATGQPAVTTSSAGIWSNSAGVLSLVARQGSQAPGCPVGATFATFTELALPDQGGLTNKGGAVFLATLNASAAAGVTTTSNTGIWAVNNAGALQLIIRTGDILGGKTVTTLAFLPPLATTSGTSRSTAQPNGDLSYLATFSDKSTAIFSVTF